MFTGRLKKKNKTKEELQHIQKGKSLRISQNQRKPLNGWAGVFHVATWNSHMIPPSNVIVTWHQTFSGFRCCGSFLPFISLDLLLAVQTNCRGRCTLHMAGHWREMNDGCGERKDKQKMRKSPVGFCDVAQRNMAGYNVWRLKKRTKFHKAIWIRNNCIWTI